MKKLHKNLFVLALGTGLSGGAYAGTATTTLDVNVNVVPACTVVATGITFPDYDGTALLYANGDVTVNCTSGVAYNIALDAGNNLSGSWRYVSNGAGSSIRYGLWQVYGATQWGDSDYDNTYPSGASLADTGDGTDQAHTVYGNLFNDSVVPTGAYSDTVNVSVYY